MVVHERYQFAVGQGFFHAASVTSAGGSAGYIYDCGSSAGGTAAAIGELSRWWSDAPRPVHPRVIFISHAHDDHLSGVPKLIRAGLMPATLVLPYIDDLSRIWSLTPALAEPSGDAEEQAFIVEYAAAGNAAFTGEGSPVRRIFEVHAGEVPPSYGEPVDPREPPRDPVSDVGGEPLSVEPQSWQGARRRGDTDVPTVGIGDHTPLVVARDDAVPIWQLMSYVDEQNTVAVARFATHLAAYLPEVPDPRSAEDLRLWLTDPANRWRLVTEPRFTRALIAAYESTPVRRGDAGGWVFGKTNGERLNATSLSLYSGPPDNGADVAEHYSLWTSEGLSEGRSEEEAARGGRVAWLGTGDADLTTPQLARFAAHFGARLDRVMTLAAPHHGSRHNSDEALYRTVRASIVVVAASAHGGYGHPHAETVRAIAAAHARLCVVDEHRGSALIEHVCMGDP